MPAAPTDTLTVKLAVETADEVCRVLDAEIERLEASLAAAIAGSAPSDGAELRLRRLREARRHFAGAHLGLLQARIDALALPPMSDLSIGHCAEVVDSCAAHIGAICCFASASPGRKLTCASHPSHERCRWALEGCRSGAASVSDLTSRLRRQSQFKNFARLVALA